MTIQRSFARAACALLLASSLSCDPYERFGRSTHRGPVDPTSFPAEYLGAGGSRQVTGQGEFRAVAGWAGGQGIEYFRFSFTSSQSKAANPLALSNAGKPVSSAPSPNAFVFDPVSDGPIPSQARCRAPAGYTFDQRAEDVRRDEQGTVFTALPTATYSLGALPTTRYVPIVSEVTATSQGLGCQEVRSEEHLFANSGVSVERGPNTTDGKPTGKPDGKYVAFAIIDPGAAVYRAALDAEGANQPKTGVGIQRWGWFKDYLLAYLDGGYIPTTTDADDVVSIRPQKLYVPRTQVDLGDGNGPIDVALGEGFDVLEAPRASASYSPVCEVLTYAAPATLTPATLPKAAADIEAAYGTTVQPGSPRYIYCLQTR